MKDGGPAFPISRSHFTSEGVMLSADWMPGMTLRQWFAGLAMQGMLASSWWCDYADKASVKEGIPRKEAYRQMAFEIADAMLKESSK